MTNAVVGSLVTESLKTAAAPVQSGAVVIETLVTTQPLTISANVGSVVFELLRSPNVLPVWTTTSPLPNAIGGNSYITTLVGSTAIAVPLTYTVTSGALPSGLSLDSGSGIISGTVYDPTSATTSTFTVTLSDGPNHVSRLFSLTVLPFYAPVWTTSAGALPNGNAGASYTYTLVATSYNPLTYTVTLGALPAGLTLNASTGVISGTITYLAIALVSNFTVTASDGTLSSDQSFSISVALPAGPVWVTTDPLPDASGGVAYSTTLVVTSTQTLTYSVISGTLPTGLTLNSTTGVISGTPPSVLDDSTSYFDISATDGVQTAVAVFSLYVHTTIAPFWSTTSPLPNGIGGIAYSTTLAATSGLTISYSLTAGSIPPGLSLDPVSGILSGTPTNPTSNTTYTMTVGVSDGTHLVTRAFILIIQANPLPAWTSTGALTNAIGGVAYTTTVIATAPWTVSYSLTSGALPAGLSLDSTSGIISGTPTNPTSNTTYNFSITATELYNTSVATFSLLVYANVAPTWITPSALAALFIDSNLIRTLVATDAHGQTVSYSLASYSSLQSALTLTTGGMLSGIPAEPAGVISFDVIATNGIASATRTFTTTINLSDLTPHIEPDTIVSNAPITYTLTLTLDQQNADISSYNAPTRTVTVTSIYPAPVVLTYNQEGKLKLSTV